MSAGTPLPQSTLFPKQEAAIILGEHPQRRRWTIAILLLLASGLALTGEPPLFVMAGILLLLAFRAFRSREWVALDAQAGLLRIGRTVGGRMLVREQVPLHEIRALEIRLFEESARVFRHTAHRENLALPEAVIQGAGGEEKACARIRRWLRQQGFSCRRNVVRRYHPGAFWEVVPEEETPPAQDTP